MKNVHPLFLYLVYSGAGRIFTFFKNRPVVFFLNMMLSLFFLVLVAGCYYYKVNTYQSTTPEAITALQNSDKIFIIHSNAGVYVLNELEIGNDSIKGIYAGEYQLPGKSYGFPLANSSNRYRMDKIRAPIYNEVHFYLKNLTTFPLPEKHFSFSFDDVQRLDIYRKDSARTAFTWIFGTAGVILGAWIAFVAVLLLVAIIGGSCPYIYVNTGNGFDFAGEIYSGAIYAPLERDDYLVLPGLIAENGEYLLKMTNEQKDEIQHTNLMELLVFDHPSGSEIKMDKYGKCLTSVEMISPSKAANFQGADILDLVRYKDSVCYSGTSPFNEITLTDGVILSFDIAQKIESAKLFIRARNSLWLDHAYKEFFGLLGPFQDNWTKMKSKSDRQQLLDWSLNQKLPLSVYIRKNGNWEFCDYYHLAGPMALKEDVLMLDLHGMDEDTLEIKLESGTYFWEIDFAGIDFTPDIPVIKTIISADIAVNENGDNITELLRHDDTAYYIQKGTESRANLSFPVPAAGNGERTVFLHSKGYYLMSGTPGGFPHLAKLNKYRKPGKFPEFSRELLHKELRDLRKRGVVDVLSESTETQ